jgi:predicted ATPase/class 3 adenylate cyclase
MRHSYSIMSTQHPRQLPTGTVTFLFTDIEGSTDLLARHAGGYESLLATHAQILRDAIEAGGGAEVNTEGDAFFAVFPSALGAVGAAADAQRKLASHPWAEDGRVRVRMGLHSGEGRLGGADYVGMDVNRAARIASAAHGGQVLLSDATRALVAQALPDGVGLRDMHEHRLKDLSTPERLWQLEIAGLATDFPTLRTLDARPNNLPTSPTSLIGRQEELRKIEGLLARRRLLTLTGPGGTGKTRLALAAAQELLSRFADGAFFVALEDAQDRATVATEIAAALGVREKPDRDLESGVRHYVRDRELLLVLDNFEQALSAAPLVTELLAAAPGLRLIVTSREVLHLSHEQEFDVPPLRLPDPRNLPAVAALSQYEAVALFIDRATAVRADFAVTSENAPAVAQVCSRLDGLPLAIELAAARVKLLSPQQILRRLERSLALLTGGARDLSGRQRTLRGAIDWSYELLEEPERELFARLGVFAGGWTLEAAEEVSNPDSGLDTLEGLSSLSDKSLVHPAAGDDAEARLEMLQVIREFALEKLDQSPQAEEVRRRHALYVVKLVEMAEPELVRADMRRWHERLRKEEENIRVALRWAVQRGESEVGMQLAGALWRFWHYWALVREGVAWLEPILELPGATQPTAERAKALTALAALVYWQGDARRASVLYEEILDIHRRLGDDAALADTLMDSAWAAAAQGDGRGAFERATQALEQYRRIGDAGGAAGVAAWLQAGAVIMNLGGSIEDAVAAGIVDLETARREGRMQAVAEALGSLALIYKSAGDLPRALEYARAELRQLHELGNIGRHGPFAKLLAKLELATGRAERAVRLAAAAEMWTDILGGELPEALIQAGDPLEDTRALLTPEEHARGVEEGKAMTLDEVVAYALDEPAATAI